MLRRTALQGLRFSEVYPKSGGGEDIDLFLKNKGEKVIFRNYKTLPEARVNHPWWNDGRPDFKKPFRYGLGNSWLAQLNPRYAYRDFLNLPETLVYLLYFVVDFFDCQAGPHQTPSSFYCRYNHHRGDCVGNSNH